ncbi:MAG TPA: ATP-binding protein [Pyrinomonadaceae bacterium]|jgi:two-component system sensor histidine kinase CpxA|nr:ATP-binding protein [Pyrinomonadaceae bacterium]
MNIFVKIFLWFLAAIALMVGMVVFLNWTVQTEPVVSRWRISARNQSNIYAETAGQIYEKEGESAMSTFLDRIRTAETVNDVFVFGEDGRAWPAGATRDNFQELMDKASASGEVEFDISQPETAVTAKPFRLSSGEKMMLVVRWERPKAIAFFGEPPNRYLRYAALLLTALLLCWALARYISSPVRKISAATQEFAEGKLDTRVAEKLGRRRDELSALANDFDEMAERIESLITSQQRLSRDVSHELRSPLARMNVALEIARQKVDGDAKPLLERIETESVRLNEMISRILTLSKLESGSNDFERREVDLKKLVELTVADADFEAHAKGKSVKIAHADQGNISASLSLVRSAVENVLRNAVRYTKEGSAVEVSLNTDGNNAAVKVRDHGGGVPEPELKNLFRPFYRVGEARERGAGGIGLGLAIAEQAVKAHGGTIHAANVGDGLEIEIVLPLNGQRV